MDYQQIELTRETKFEDAVLQTAHEKAQAMVDDARQKREQALQQAQLSCQRADRTLIESETAADAERDYSAAVQSAKREVLKERDALVQGVFSEVRQKLVAFASSGEYGPWLQGRLKARLAGVEAGAPLRIRLRKEDMQYAGALQTLAPGSVAEEDGEIELGGLKLAAGHLLFDETLDNALSAQQQKFVESCGLRVE